MRAHSRTGFPSGHSHRNPAGIYARTFRVSVCETQTQRHSMFHLCVCFPCRSKTHVFEEFLFAWHDRLRKLEEQTSMSVKLQKEVDRYKVTWVDYSGCLLVLCETSSAVLKIPLSIADLLFNFLIF